jgi:hypothetical protein
MRKLLARLVAVALAVSIVPLSGCSLAFMNRAPDPVAVPDYPVECTSSRAAPVLDTICGGYFVANGLYWAAQRSCNEATFGQTCVDADDQTTGVLLSAGLATLCTASAVAGYRKASGCEMVKRENAACITGDEQACLRLAPNWRPAVRKPAEPVSPAAPVPASASLAPLGGRCDNEVDCAIGLLCGAGRCMNPPEEAGASHDAPGARLGLACVTHAECAAGLVCPYGRCVEPTR